LAENAIPVGSRHRSSFELGRACGTYLSALRQQSDAALSPNLRPRSNEIPIPTLQPVVQAARQLTQHVPISAPLLQALATTTVPSAFDEHRTWLVKLLRAAGLKADFDVYPRDVYGDNFVIRQCLDELVAGLSNELSQLVVSDASNTSMVATCTPRWDNSCSSYTLYLGTRIARRVVPRASNVIKVLDAFEEEKWPERIDDPTDAGKLHETLRSLNQGLQGMRFRADGTGQGICWMLDA
jgi:hypothetical protein